MRRIFTIAVWEWGRFLRTRRFWFMTILAPALVTGLLLLPTFYYETSQANQGQVIGCVSLDTTNYCQLLAERMLSDPEADNGKLRLLIESIPPDTSETLRMDIVENMALQRALDSLSESYENVQKRREYLFGRPESATKTRLLRESYDELIKTREQLDMARETGKRLSARLDTLVRQEALQKADSLLTQKRIAGYVVIEPVKFSRGKIDFHTRLPMASMALQPLEHALQVLLVEERLRKDGLQITEIQDVMQPVEIREVPAENAAHLLLNARETYIVPVIALLFFLIFLLTVCGMLAYSIYSEKSHQMSEMLISGSGTVAMVTGKTLGIWLLGLLQLLIWVLIAFFLVQLNLLPSERIPFLSPAFAGYFAIYATLGYLLFGGWYIIAGSLSNRTREMFWSMGILNVLVILPLLLVAYVLFSPASIFVRFMTYLPVLTPAFMLLRIPMAPPPMMEYYITGAIIFIFVIIGFSIAGKIYRNASLNVSRIPFLRRLPALLQMR